MGRGSDTAEERQHWRQHLCAIGTEAEVLLSSMDAGSPDVTAEHCVVPDGLHSRAQFGPVESAPEPNAAAQLATGSQHAKFDIRF